MAGGGVGEAMLIGAAVGATAGGAGAAIQGGDPLKGALMGGAMGAVGGGLGGAGAGAAGGAMEGGAGGATVGAGAGTTVGTTAGTTAGAGVGDVFAGWSPTGSSAATMSNIANTGAGISGVGAGSGTLGSAGFGPMVSSNTAGLNALAASQGVGTAGAAGAGLEVAPNVINPANAGIAGAQPPVTNVFGQTAGTPGYLSNTQLGMTGATAGLAGAMQAERANLGTPPDKKYDGPLSKLKYDPNSFEASTPQYAPASVYRPTYAAQGGIMESFRSGGIDTNTVGDYDDKPGTDDLNAGGTAQYNKGGVTHFDLGGMAMTGLPSGGQAAQQQQSYGSGIDALMGSKKRMLTKEQMDAIKMQGMSKGALKDVYGQMASQNLARGGSAGNKDMAAIDAYMAAAQGGDMSSVMAKAQAGDYNAMLALNKLKSTPNQNYATGGSLGGYSDGGRMLKGPGDGMSDNIPATIANKQPARLADGEFVVPADVVSHLGNGSTDAGAKQLYSMMERVRKARTGNKKQGKQIKPTKYMVA